MDRGVELATETVKCTDKIKSLITNLTKEVNTLQDKTTENKLNTLQIRELHEMETEEMVEERLKAFAIPISEVKAILNANEMKSWGKSSRIRDRLLDMWRGKCTAEDRKDAPSSASTITADGTDTAEEITADELSVVRARRELEERKKAKNKNTGRGRPKPDHKEKDIKYLTPKGPMEQVNALYAKLNGPPVTPGDIIPNGTIVCFRYGTWGETPYSPGNGATPGEWRLAKVIEAGTVMTNMQRFEIRGNFLAFARKHDYTNDNIEGCMIVNDTQLKWFKKSMQVLTSSVAESGDETGIAPDANIEKDNESYISELSTPRETSSSAASSSTGVETAQPQRKRPLTGAAATRAAAKAARTTAVEHVD